MSAAKQSVIECEGVEVEFRRGREVQRVLHGLNLQVQKGQIVTLLGPSGCGKSTLLRVVAGLTQADRGEVRVFGAGVEESQRKLAFVFQESALLPWRTVWQNVHLPSEIRREAGDPKIKERIERVLELVGFRPSDWTKKPSQLSGGMKMRASIARALITDPELLLLDEPFAALDDMLRSKLNDLLLEIAQRTGCTMLFVTHNIAEAIYLSHRIAVFRKGKIGEEITIDLPFPRAAGMRSSVEFAGYYGRVSESLMRSSE